MTKQELARELVDRCANNPSNKTSEDLGRNIYEELQTSHKGDTEMLHCAVHYMMELANQYFGEGADHQCIRNHYKN